MLQFERMTLGTEKETTRRDKGGVKNGLFQQIGFLNASKRGRGGRPKEKAEGSSGPLPGMGTRCWKLGKSVGRKKKLNWANIEARRKQKR